MALVNRSFSVNVTPGMMPPIVHVSEYDVGRAYTVSILDEQGNTFTIPSGTTASIEGTLNGSVGFTQSATVSNNQVSFTLSQSMTAYSGKAWCKIKLTQNSQPIQTCAFVLAVDRAGVEADTVIGAPGFEEQIRDAAEDWLEEQGFQSPTVSITDIEGGHRVTFTDAQHPQGQSIDVMDGTSVAVDPTLSIEGAAADAKATGDKFDDLKSAFETAPKNVLPNQPLNEFTVDGLSVVIEGDEVRLNGTLNLSSSDAGLRIKLTNGVEYVRAYTSPAAWNSERIEGLKRDSYYYGYDILVSGSQSASGAVMSVRDSSSASKISTQRSPYFYAASDSALAYAMFFVPINAVYTNAVYKLVLTNTNTKEYPGILDSSVINPDSIRKLGYTAWNSELYKTIEGVNFNAVQGLCIHDGFLYYGIVLNNQDGNNIIGKINLSTGNIVATRNVSVGHCNGMTFNEKDGYIHVVALSNDGLIYRVSTDLEVIDNYNIDLSDLYHGYSGVGGVAYDADTDSMIYLIRGIKKGYAVYDGSCNFKNLFWSDFVNGLVYGDFCVKGGFIYQIIHEAGGSNIIAITNMTGAVVKKVSVPLGYEAESIDYSGDTFYVSSNKSTYDNHEIYKLTTIDAEYLPVLRS